MNSINILFTGDFAPCRDFESIVLDKKEKVLGDTLPLIEAADCSFTNLECVLTNNNKTINKSGPTLKANPKCVEALKHFSVVGLANNHILDYDEQGLQDTILACENIGLSTVGSGMDLAQAQKPFIYEVKGVKLAIIAIAEHEFNQSENNSAGSAPIDPIDNYQQVQYAKENSDVVIITLHGGNEYFPYPRPGLRKLCRHYIDLGVEAVICHHPHVPGAYEYYKDKPIIYSLGNFVFDNEKSPEGWNEGYMARLNIDRNKRVFIDMELIPYRQSVELGGVCLYTGKEKEMFLKKIETYRNNLEKNIEWQKEWKNFVLKHSGSYILRHFSPFCFRGLGLLARNTPIAKLFYNYYNCLPKLNMLRCQSHKELLTASLEEKSRPRNTQK